MINLMNAYRKYIEPRTNQPKEVIDEYIDGVIEHEDPEVINNTTLEQRLQDFNLYVQARQELT